MFEWNVEKMELTNNHYEVDRVIYFNCENEVSKEDKIAFVDKMYDGKLSYILNLFDKFNNDVENLSRDKNGYIRTVSLKAWIKKNDTKYGTTDHSRLIDAWYKYGEIYFLGCRRYIQNPNFLSMKGYTFDTHANYVDEIFHRALIELLRKENQYFKEHDEYEILKSKFIHSNHYELGIHIGYSSNGNVSIYDENDNSRPITIEELKLILDKYAEIEAFVEEVKKTVNITF